MIRWLQRLGWACSLLVGAALLVLCFPQPLFAYQLRYGPYSVWSDRPIPPALRPVLDEVTARLARSDLYSTDQRFRVFICNENWRLAIYSQQFSGAMGGVTDNIFTRNVYLRESDITRNRIIPPGGWGEFMLDRPLTYYIAHELTHVMESRAFGRSLELRYPRWLIEGYADYIGKAGRFDYVQNRRALLAGARELDPARSGLYRLFHLEVAYLLDRKHERVRQLFEAPPREEKVRAALLREAR